LKINYKNNRIKKF